ncbi:subtilisin-like protein [Apiospora aurea]|uniref:Subtilisin-like protein n=1 Tax=Apiospora aurea TaxID=335848 RepID=A0ABR1QA16_9PEZI
MATSSIFRSTLSAALLLLLLPLGLQAAPTPGLIVANPDATNIVPDSYILKYRKGVSHEVLQRSQQSARDLMQLSRRGAAATIASDAAAPANLLADAASPFLLHFFNISSSFHGAHVQADHSTVRRISQDPAVEYVLYDTYVTNAGSAVRQPDAVSSLARISQSEPLQSKEGDYTYDESAGEGVTVYIIDSGIYVDHPDFEGRAHHGYNAFDKDSNSHDDNGHGTNVAGIVGSATFGVAKKAELVAVKVLDSQSWGTWSGIIDGMQWAADDAKTRRRNVGRAIINMSIQSDRVDAMNDMLEAIHDDGIPVVVCAGNYNKDASTVSPASAPSAITVGAIDENDNKADFSDYGEDVDIFAPGVKVVSLSHNGGTSTYTGTSQGESLFQASMHDDETDLVPNTKAAPHVAGIAALLMSSEGLKDPDEIASRIRSMASDMGAEVQANAQGTSNLIANNGFY